MTWQDFLPLRRFVTIVHHVPGRIRLRLDRRALTASLKGGAADSLSVAEIQQRLEALPGLKNLRISKPTLSAVLEYDCTLLPAERLEHVLQAPEEAALAAIEDLNLSAPAQPS